MIGGRKVRNLRSRSLRKSRSSRRVRHSRKSTRSKRSSKSRRRVSRKLRGGSNTLDNLPTINEIDNMAKNQRLKLLVLIRRHLGLSTDFQIGDITPEIIDELKTVIELKDPPQRL